MYSENPLHEIGKRCPLPNWFSDGFSVNILSDKIWWPRPRLGPPNTALQLWLWAEGGEGVALRVLQCSGLNKIYTRVICLKQHWASNNTLTGPQSSPAIFLFACKTILIWYVMTETQYEISYNMLKDTHHALQETHYVSQEIYYFGGFESP